MLTERRIIHEEVQKMLHACSEMLQPSESPWSSPVVLSFIKGFVIPPNLAVVAEKWAWSFIGVLKRCEAFHSLKKALTSDPQYWGCTTKELLQKSILMQAGTVSELS
ncbi:hypothetical protein TNCV_4409841 [Trichonephila clavipes]|nr:hypothetical protein TNCV_4409841 [Trichonephila clavipes]